MKEKIDLKVTPNITKLLNNAFLLASSSENVELYDHMSMLCEAVYFMKLLKEEIVPLIKENPNQVKFTQWQVNEILDHFLG